MTVTHENMDRHFELANKLLTDICAQLALKNDAALSRALEVAPPTISKIRNGHVPMGDNMLIRLHELTGITVRELKTSLEMDSIPLYEKKTATD